ncbi:Sodium-dependent multivitamin transporter [Armadillidium vulgare]|nr:Sodium-dependent multivitamin transporter [Armadillidium vulgare]
MGNRNLKTLPVAMSLLTSYISAIGLLGFSGEVYGNGLQIGSIILGGPSALIFASYFVLPVLYPLKLTSINEYIELRFKSKNLRVAVFIPIYLKAIFTSAVALYATSLALAPIANFDNLTNILLLGIICTIYSSFGGIRAIVWTDVFQLIIMMVGFTTIVTIGIIQNGGFIETLHTASKGGRMEFFENCY